MVDVLKRACRVGRGAHVALLVCVLTFSSLDLAAASDEPMKLAMAPAVSIEPAVERHETQSGSRDARCLAIAVYFEARGESERGQRAVADVVLARVRTAGWPKTVCGVVYQGAQRRTGCQFSFACDGLPERPRGEAWLRAKEIAADALDAPKPASRSAIYFHTKNVKPSWSKRMVRVASIGSHIFYRPRRARS
jgi:spore germination cell wall hydrolase CwlJ-like protein